MIIWSSLEALWLLIPVGLSLCFYTHIWSVLRLMITVMIIVLLINPQLEWGSGSPKVIVVLDQSESCKQEVDKAYREIEHLLSSSMPKDGVLNTFAFAKDTVTWPLDEVTELGKHESRLQTALLQVGQQSRPSESAKILLVSDGWSTENLDRLGSYYLKSNQSLYWYQVRRDSGSDYFLTSFKVPEQTFQNETFLIDVELSGPGTDVTVELTRDGQLMGEFPVSLTAGRGYLRLKDRLTRAGSYRYQARLKHPEDSFHGNNVMTSMVQVDGQGSVLLLSSYRDDPIKESLLKMGLKVHQVENFHDCHVGQLNGARAVIIHNVSANEFSIEFLRALVSYVELQGGGLAMIGGKNSFASGGYYHSQIDPLLPVSMELKEDKYKISLALGIVLDRSGSMSVMTSSGKSKMQLANEGAATAVELLGHNDALTVFAVDSLAHCIVGLSRVDSGKEALANQIRSIESRGGGIFVYEGLVYTWEEMRNAPMPNKHIILFSDASDSEQPGDYIRLLDELQTENCSVSVIGLGSRTDTDASLLEDIAKRGGGRIFFCQDAMDLPAIFSQETAAVARSTFIEERRGIVKSHALMELGIGVKVPQSIQAFNLCQSRKGASTALWTSAEEKDPVLAFWNRGAGKVLAITTPMAGEFASELLSESPYHSFNSSWIQWLLKDPLPVGISLEQERIGNQVEIKLYFNETWQEKFSNNPPQLKTINLKGNHQESNVTWERLEPGQFKSKIDLEGNDQLVGALSVGNTQIPFGPLELGYSKEWFPDKNMEYLLRQTAKESGGGLAPRLDKLWEFEKHKQYQSFRPFICVVILLLILLEMLCYKLGWRLNFFSLNYFSPPKWVSKRATSEVSAGEKEEPISSQTDPFQARLDKFKRKK